MNSLGMWSALMLGSVLLAAPAANGDTTVVVDPSTSIATVPDGLYSAGYNGWRDILDEKAILHLQGIGIRYLRLPVKLSLLCGDKQGDLDLSYAEAQDCGVGFLERIRTVIRHGWSPILVTTIHSGAEDGGVPTWFYGDVNDKHGRAWYRFNRDGSPAEPGKSDQYPLLTESLQRVSASLAEAGISGLLWETIYECGHLTPMVEIHYHAAKGIRAADPTAKILGPATWPGWTVDECFVKPYLKKYGADFLDLVSMHWYTTNSHSLWETPFFDVDAGTIISMDNEGALTYLMEQTPEYGRWAKALRQLLDSREFNPEGKHIGIAFTEYDANCVSPYQRTPANLDWPNYTPESDCYINTNYFGGVWCASVLCNLAASGSLDIACKFNTRNYYGIIDQAGPAARYYRTPLWYAWKMLREIGGMVPGATMLRADVDGPLDAATAHKTGISSPWVEAYAVGDRSALQIVLINRSFAPHAVDLSLLSPDPRQRPLKVTRYVFSKDRVAPFIGSPAGAANDGSFKGSPDDDTATTCLAALDELPVTLREEALALPGLTCPPISMTILRFDGR